MLFEEPAPRLSGDKWGRGPKKDTPLRPSALPGRGTQPRTKRAIRRGILEETSLAALSGEFVVEWLPWS